MDERMNDDFCRRDLKGGIGNVVDCTTTYPGERCRHHRPLGPVATLRRAPINRLVESGVVCSSAPSVSATSEVLPIADRTDGFSTIATNFQRLFPCFLGLSVWHQDYTADTAQHLEM